MLTFYITGHLQSTRFPIVCNGGGGVVDVVANWINQYTYIYIFYLCVIIIVGKSVIGDKVA